MMLVLLESSVSEHSLEGHASVWTLELAGKIGAGRYCRGQQGCEFLVVTIPPPVSGSGLNLLLARCILQPPFYGICNVSRNAMSLSVVRQMSNSNLSATVLELNHTMKISTVHY